MLPQEIIATKRDGGILSAAQIEAYVQGVTNGQITDGQIGAMCMAIVQRGLNDAERVELTMAMARSGRMIDWRSEKLPGPVIDKHSTGGVGDKISLMLAPMVAAVGGYVPMFSGRGLGHTGGTLDKMQCIPNYNALPDEATIKRVVAEVGCAILGATAEFAPADKRIYAIRDTTATVESLDLIVASILSKKLALGADALLMDVKYGSGAFLPDYAQTRSLAAAICTVANGAGLKTSALLTDMNELLGFDAGNNIEVLEAVDYLTGARHEPRIHAITMALCVEMLRLSGLETDAAKATQKLEQALATGAAAEKFARMITALGGPADFVDAPKKYLAAAPLVKPCYATQAGYIQAMDVREIGWAIVALGGGRLDPTHNINPTVGLTDMVRVGQKINSGDVLCLIHAADEAALAACAARLHKAIHIGDTAPTLTPLIKEHLF